MDNSLQIKRIFINEGFIHQAKRGKLRPGLITITRQKTEIMGHLSCCNVLATTIRVKLPLFLHKTK
jgi:hypothetical protein